MTCYLHKVCAAGIVLLFACALAAAPGDRLQVKAKLANVRSGPASGSAIVMRLQQGSIVIERQREKDWIEIERVKDQTRTGWIHASLVAKAGPDSPATATSADPLYDLFLQAYATMNKRLLRDTGKAFFAKVENVGNRVIQLTITDDWLALTRPQREQRLNEIFTIWDAAVGDDIPITVDIVDADGNRLMSKFK